MKIITFLLLVAAGLLAGCETFSTKVHDRFSTVAPQTRTFAADRRTVYTAAQQAVTNVGLLLGRTSSSKGEINAYAPIRGGNATSDARQTTMVIRLNEVSAAETEVSLLVSEQTEGSFPGGVSEQALREHSLYRLYYAALQQILVDGGAIAAPAGP
jgi:hypothetical protein